MPSDEKNRKPVLVCLLGRISHGAAWELQLRLWAARQEGRIPDVLLLLEHPPTITMGKRNHPENILVPEEHLKRLGVDLCHTDRGGDVTYHGPGQLVGYLILNLAEVGIGVKRYVHDLETVFINLLRREFGLDAGRDAAHRGVWVNGEKILAIGCAVRRKITLHGFAFNVDPDLAHFAWIHPCGITDRGVTSLARLTGREHDLTQTAALIAGYLCETFALRPQKVDPAALRALLDAQGMQMPAT